MGEASIMMIESLEYTFEQLFAIMGTISDIPHPGEVNVIARVGNIEYIEGGVEQRKLVMMVEEFAEDDWDDVLGETVFALGQLGGLVPSGSG